jgi:hypothetical protein
MRKHFTKRRVILLAVVALAIGIGAGAYAFFTNTGHGSGSVSVGHATAFTITSEPAVGGPLMPLGEPSTYQSVEYTVTNPLGGGAQQLNNVNVEIAGTDPGGDPAVWSVPGTGGNPDCTKADFELSLDPDGTYFAYPGEAVDTSDPVVPQIDAVPAKDLEPGESVSGTVWVRMVDTGANQDACQGATVPLYFSAS